MFISATLRPSNSDHILSNLWARPPAPGHWREAGMESTLVAPTMKWDLMCEAVLCDGAGKPIGVVDGSFLVLEGMTAVGLPDPSRLMVYDWTTGERRAIAMNDRPASMALSYMEIDATLLPNALPVVSGSVVNNAVISDDDVDIISDEDYDSEQDMDIVWPEEEVRLMNIRLDEEADEYEEQEQMGVASNLDDPMRIGSKMNSIIDSMIVPSKFESKRYTMLIPAEFFPRCASDFTRREERYAEYAKISGIE